MATFSTSDLFDIITCTKTWFNGNGGDIAPFCDANAAAVMKHRHKKGELSDEAYTALFFHFGYKKELSWTK